MLEIYDFETKIYKEEKCIKMEKFFLDFYPLIKKQKYVEIERNEVVLKGICSNQK